MNIQVANNGGENFVDPDELYAAWMEYCEDDAKGEIVRLFIDESGETSGRLVGRIAAERFAG